MDLYEILSLCVDYFLVGVSLSSMVGLVIDLGNGCWEVFFDVLESFKVVGLDEGVYILLFIVLFIESDGSSVFFVNSIDYWIEIVVDGLLLDYCSVIDDSLLVVGNSGMMLFFGSGDDFV